MTPAPLELSAPGRVLARVDAANSEGRAGVSGR